MCYSVIFVLIGLNYSKSIEKQGEQSFIIESSFTNENVEPIYNTVYVENFVYNFHYLKVM